MVAKALPDQAARVAALTQLDRSLLVEAGAGSGKTAIMAGRVAMLLAQGVEPKRIAAVTFTEFAASELMIRITRFVAKLANGEVPPELEIAFPKGVAAQQQANLDRAKKSLDQLVCSTVHGFAQALIKPYPIEAGIDPGAEIIDPSEADIAFDEHYDAWLRRRLSGELDDDVVAEIVLADENGALDLLKEIADFRRHNRDARPGSAPWTPDLVQEFARVTASFRRALAGLAFQEPDTVATAEDLADCATALGSAVLHAETLTNRALIGCLLAARPESCFTQAGAMRQLKTKGKWEKAAAAAGRSKADGVEAYDTVRRHYEACHEAFQNIMAAAAGSVLERTVVAMDGLMADWRAYKHAAALLDFDDLLYTARDLLAGHEQVRQALAHRFQHVLVDEFQDTDPLQIDILWRLCGEAQEGGGTSARSRALRPGALFLVGDPKQAIYRFRGADVNAYIGARAAVGESALLQITANFRSVEPILSFVNEKFETALSTLMGQPGFTALSSICEAQRGLVAIAALDVKDGEEAKAHEMRDAEADRVAELCSRLVENRLVRDKDERGRDIMRPCRLGDIALLAPVGTELWRFEQALEDRGIAVSTQAGKGFFRRQEIQDLIALTRTLADGRDSLALGALLRGPLVGLTEAELLDIVESLPIDQDRPDRLPQLNLWTDPDHIEHDLAQGVIRSLQSLAKRSRSTTPYALISDAIGLLHARPQLRQRFKTGADRALANVDVFLEMSRAYDVRGLRAFANDMRANWDEAVRQVEGRPDAEEQSVALVTIHASKGLEWPIVIPINMTGAPRAESGLIHDRRSERFSIPIFGVEPEDYEAIKEWNAAELERERVRLWYVAATRARDLLILPRHSCPLKDRAYARIVDFDLPSLGAINPETLGKSMTAPSAGEENQQTRDVFAEQASIVLRSHKRIEWRQPSRGEATASLELDYQQVFSNSASLEDAVGKPAAPISGGATRGTILHKLMEEVLNGETVDNIGALVERASELLTQLSLPALETASQGISPQELAQTIARTLNIPDIAMLRPRLIPEQTIYQSCMDEGAEVIVSGVADAIAYDAEGRVEVVVDWKSDVEIDLTRLNSYRGQIEAYKRHTGAKSAFLVLMTPGKVMAC
jgi:ATP-dependent exoDNAse (exonuclease V) beta subunit